VPVVVLGELRAGFLQGRHRRENERALRAFLDHPVVAVLDVDEEAAGHYAQIVVALRTAGTPVPTNDIWIGALAAREGAMVLTYDQHFDSIARVGSIILEAPDS
jgi:tRNA(fMet)-specific endonuclease VapC